MGPQSPAAGVAALEVKTIGAAAVPSATIPSAFAPPTSRKPPGSTRTVTHGSMVRTGLEGSDTAVPATEMCQGWHSLPIVVLVVMFAGRMHAAPDSVGGTPHGPGPASPPSCPESLPPSVPASFVTPPSASVPASISPSGPPSRGRPVSGSPPSSPMEPPSLPVVASTPAVMVIVVFLPQAAQHTTRLATIADDFRLMVPFGSRRSS